MIIIIIVVVVVVVSVASIYSYSSVSFWITDKQSVSRLAWVNSYAKL